MNFPFEGKDRRIRQVDFTGKDRRKNYVQTSEEENEMGASETGFSFKPRNWSDVVSITGIITAIIGILVWGLKMDDRQLYLEKEHGEIKTQMASNIIPATKDTFTWIINKLDEIDHRMARVESKLDSAYQKNRQ
jgi:hypothetical protein